LLSGVLLAASFPKFGHPAFAWIALSPLIVGITLSVTSGWRGPRHLFLLAASSGFVYFAGMLYWAVGTMATYGGIGGWVAFLVGVLMWAYLAIYVGLFGALFGLAVRRFGTNGIWLAPACWVASEWVRSNAFGGFPWGTLGASQASVLPIVQLASVTGVHGLSALVSLVSAAAAALAFGRRRSTVVGAAAVGALLVAVTAGGTARLAASALTRTGTVTRVGLVQGNVDLLEKWDPRSRDLILSRYLALSQQAIGAGASMVFWPEASTPFYFDAEGVLADPVRRLALQSHVPFIIGTDEYQYGTNGAGDRIFNTAVVVGVDGLSHGTYRKMRLVPFGEFVPLKKLLFFVGPLVQSVSDFSEGTEPVVLDANGRKVSVAICYESIYPEIDRAFVLRGSELLATITNDAWFGRSSAPYQHFAMGAIRAVEEGRYVVRAANTGISGAVDPYGRVLLATPLFEPASVTVDVRLLTGRTIYGRLGDVVVWISMAIAVAAAVAGLRSGPRR
jgi:apolipoprotein N-acyltransferase